MQTNEEATVYVYDLDLFVTVQILEDTPAVLSLGTLCEDHEYSCEWTRRQEHTMQHGEFRAPGLVNQTFQLVYEYILNIGIAGLNGSSTGRPVARFQRDQKQKKNEGCVICQFADNSVNEEASASSEAPTSISREPLHQEPPRKVVSGKHRPKLQGLLAENALAIKYLEQKNDDQMNSRSQKFFVRIVNLETVTSIQWW